MSTKIIFFLILIVFAGLTTVTMFHESDIPFGIINDCTEKCVSKWDNVITNNAILLGGCSIRCFFDSAFDIFSVWNGESDTYRILFIPLSGPCDTMTQLQKDIINVCMGFGIILVICSFFVGGLLKEALTLLIIPSILSALHCGRIPGLPPIRILYLIEAITSFARKIIILGSSQFQENESQIIICIFGLIIITLYIVGLRLIYGSFDDIKNKFSYGVIIKWVNKKWKRKS